MEYIIGLVVLGGALWWFFKSEKEVAVTEVITKVEEAVAPVVEEAKSAKKPTVKKATTRKPKAAAKKAPAKKAPAKKTKKAITK